LLYSQFAATRLSCLLMAIFGILLQAPIAISAETWSADGRYFVFSTEASLVVQDENGLEDVYRYDRFTGEILLVSVATNNVGSGDAASYAPVIDGFGDVVAFVSDAGNLSPLDHNNLSDVFVRDMALGSTTLISLEKYGTNGANGRSFRPQLSSDGTMAAFESEATDLVAVPDANGEANDVFVRNRDSGTTSLVSMNHAGTASGSSGALLGAISADGRVVVFESQANDLTTNDSNFTRDVFVRDLAGGVTTLVSLNWTGAGSGNADSFDASVSASGTVVLFGSNAGDLVPNDNNAHTDIFVRDLNSGETRLVSARLDGAASANGDSFAPKLSADGSMVAFASLAADLSENDTNEVADVFACDLATGTTRLVSINAGGTHSANGYSGDVALSANGEVVAFASRAGNLTTNAADGMPNVFVRDLALGETKLATVNQAGSASGTGPAFSADPALSSNGCALAFRSLAEGLAAQQIPGTRWFITGGSNSCTNQPASTNALMLRISLDGAALALSLPANGGATIETSQDLIAWSAFDTMAILSVSTNLTDGVKNVRVQRSDQPGSSMFFRLVLPTH